MIDEKEKLTDYTLSVKDVAKKLGYNVDYVRTLANTGKIPAIKRLREWRFSEKELLDFFKYFNPDKNTKKVKVIHDEAEISDLIS